VGGREEGYYGPSSSDLGRGSAVLMAVGAIVLVLLVALCCCSAQEEPVSGRGEAAAEAPGTDIAIDVTDQRAMHDAGLPTKADVLAWHMYGRWAFYKMVDGVQEVHIWEDLPGGSYVWDALYGLDPDNQAFKFKDDVRGDDDEA